MTILKHSKIDKEFVFDKKSNYLLCIENQKFYREVITELQSNLEQQVNFYLLEDNKILALKKNICFVPNPLDFALDEKKLNTQIQKEISTFITPEENEGFLVLLNKINDYLDSICYDYPLRLGYDSEMDITSFLKAFSVKYREKEDNFLITIIEHVKVLSSLFNYKVIIFLNLIDFLTSDELNLFFQECERLEIPVLLLCSHLPKYEFDKSFIVRIDEDLCEIHIDSESENF